MGLTEDRAAYETAVRDLARVAIELSEAGHPIAFVAAVFVHRRNRLKADYRRGIPADILVAIEARNVVRYGDPLGPGAELLLARYGHWQAVIDAACRPADLSGVDPRRIDNA